MELFASSEVYLFFFIKVRIDDAPLRKKPDVVFVVCYGVAYCWLLPYVVIVVVVVAVAVPSSQPSP